MKRLIEFFRILNAPCEDMSGLISQSLDRDLPRSLRFAYRFHTVYCRACRRYEKHLHLLRAALRRAREHIAAPLSAPGPALSDAARSRIRDAIHNQ